MSRDDVERENLRELSRGPGRRRMTEIFVGGAGGRRPSVPLRPDELEREARRHMSDEAWAYVAGGAGREETAGANRRALDRHRIVPRMLRGIEAVDLSTELFGRRLPAPLLFSPIGVLEMVHRRADLAVASAAARLGLPMIFSNQASRSMEECADAMGDAPRFFQLYWSTSDELVESFLRRAADCGCDAVVLTLDTTTLGWRPRDLELAHLPFLRGQGLAQYVSDPVFRASLDEPLDLPTNPPQPPLGPSAVWTLLQQVWRFPGSLREKLSPRPVRAVRRFLASYSRPSLSWDDLPWLRERTELPILLKGIQHPDDARRAVDHGMDGIIVSNHGGRQVDGAVGSLDALARVVAEVDGDVPVLFDSGIRSGSDVFKALALGARAVCVGRPWVYGLAIDGEDGVRQVMENLLAELELTMILAGCASLGEIDRSVLTDPKPPLTDQTELR